MHRTYRSALALLAGTFALYVAAAATVPRRPQAAYGLSIPLVAALDQWGISIITPYCRYISENLALRDALTRLPFTIISFGNVRGQRVMFQHVPSFTTAAWYFAFTNVRARAGASPHVLHTHFSWVGLFVDTHPGRVIQVIAQQ